MTTLSENQLDQQSRMEWDGDTKLRDEFATLDCYRAFRKAEAIGDDGKFGWRGHHQSPRGRMISVVTP